MGFRPEKIFENKIRPRVLKTIKCDNKFLISIDLPKIAVYNHRSIWSKIDNFALEFDEINFGIAFTSEIWEKKRKKRKGMHKKFKYSVR